MNHILLIGAGASFGSGPCNPCPPPLGKGLYRALRARGGLAASIASPLAEVFEEDFEAGMIEFEATRDTDVTGLLRETACYFNEFSILRGNYYCGLSDAIRRTPHRVTVVTTNYDTLIEQAAPTAGLGVIYGAERHPGAMSILKIHGSCNFLPDFGPGVKIRGSKFGTSINAHFSGPVRIVFDAREVGEFCATEDSIAQAIAVYAPGKKVLFAPQFVLDQQAQWRQEADATDQISIVGMRVLETDDHIWGTLADSRAKLAYIGLREDAAKFKAWAAKRGRAEAQVLSSTFAEALPLLRTQLLQ